MVGDKLHAFYICVIPAGLTKSFESPSLRTSVCQSRNISLKNFFQFSDVSPAPPYECISISANFGTCKL